MQLISVLATLALALPSFAAHVLHEKREWVPAGWIKGSRLEPHTLMPLRIALTQQNLHRLDAYLDDVAHPESVNFAKHWNAKKVAETFAPSKESKDAVIDWLIAGGIEEERVADSMSQSLGWLHLDVTAAEAESLLQTKYYEYIHGDTGKKQLACESYSLPSHIQQHVDFVTPTLHFDAKIHPIEKHDELEGRGVKKSSLGSPGSASLPKLGATFADFKTVFEQLKNCSDFITPVCLKALYSIPPALTNIQKNPFGIVEYSPQAYIQEDLNVFFNNFSKFQRQKTPTLISVNGGVPQTQQQGFQFNGESNLDLEYGMTLSNPISVSLYQVGDNTNSGSFNTFLDALDASYCTFQGGDDRTQDPAYPNTVDPSGYQGPNQCGGAAAAKVISTSYGYNEADLTPFYEQRQCAEYAKLSLMGSSILYSSGDYGVAGNGGQCIDPATGQFNDGASGIFNPSFPGGCPYITSVGATQIPKGSSVFSAEAACETVIYSGGGFSNVFSLPNYQKAAVTNYLKNEYKLPYGSERFNNSGTSRAFPDISANGANYLTQIDGQAALIYGTSASAPVFAAIIAIVNEYRAALGKKSLGFLNPFFYANPYLFNDITQGGNQGCGTPGFQCVKGWDPVTGLGTPRTLLILGRALLMP